MSRQAERQAILCYSCSLATGRDVPYTARHQLMRHSWVDADRWYNRYPDAPYAVETTHHGRQHVHPTIDNPSRSPLD